MSRVPGAGFTTTELLCALGIVGIVSVLAVRGGGRGRKGELAPAFARTVLATVHQARQAAIAKQRRTRLTVNFVNNTLQSEIQDSSGNWTTLNGVLTPPNGVSFCTLV